MAKVYSVTIPGHSGGGNFEVVSQNEAGVKELICISMKRSSIPRGTVIKKLGLTKKPNTRALGKVQEQKKEINKKEVEEPSDSLRSRAKKKKIVPEVPVEKIIEKEKEDIKKQHEKESLEYFHTDFGFSLRKDKMVTLKSKMDFKDCTLYILEDDNSINVWGIGEECIVTIKRGTKLWLYLDHSQEKNSLKELQNHI